MTDYETLAAQGIPPKPAESSDTPYPSRRSLRSNAPVVASGASASSSSGVYPSRRAAREAAARYGADSSITPAAPVVAAAAPVVPSAPQVAAPFGIFGAAPEPEKRSRAERHPVAPKAPTAGPRRRPLRKQLTAAGTMVLVGGLFASLTLPAYASNDFSAPVADAASKVGSQALALSAASTDSVEATAETRDGYDATSAADLKRLYRDAQRQQNLQAYLASGAKEMGDDYPWPAELTPGQGGGLSPLNYFYRECVDFVAWRLNRDAGSTKAPFKYTWSTLTPGNGSARSWKKQWENHGWPISTTPAPGWVAWFPGMNHVAYVSGILDDGSVAIEEYNWGPNIYGQRIIQPGDAIYLSPPPR